MAVDKDQVVSTGRGFSGQALIDQADVLLAIAAADMAELKKYGWSEAKHKELDKPCPERA